MRYEHGIVSTFPSDMIYHTAFQRTHDRTWCSTKASNDTDKLLVDIPGDDARDGYYVAFSDP